MTPFRRLAAAALAALAAAAAIWTLVLAATGGVHTTIAGVRISSSNAWRPAAIAAIAAGLFLLVAGRAGARRARGRAAAACTPARAAAALSLAIVVVGLAGNSWTASGPDSYAYVSQAALWRGGSTRLPVPLAADAPWPDPVGMFAKPGYRPAPDGSAALVPVTAPGLPLLMALLQSASGHAAAFVITPIAGGVLVFLTFLIGRRVGGDASGLTAAGLVATSPAFLYMLMWPMTDIPTAAVTAVMVACLMGTSVAGAAAAGVAAAAGLLVRPNFVLIAAAAWAWLLADAILFRGAPGRRWFRLVAFSIAALPGEIVMAAINTRWYGAPFASGYGDVGGLLSIDRAATNLAHYAGWFATTSPIGVIGLVALALPFSRIWPSPSARRSAWLFALTTAAAVSIYIVYTVFIDWWYLRFLLPAWPAVFVATAMAIRPVWERGRLARTAAALALVAYCGWSVSVADARWVFDLGKAERRYATVAHLVAAYTPPDAVILTAQHSGTVRYYAGRETLRWDFLDPEWLDRAIAWLDEHGHPPYLLIEDWEQPQFEARFGSNSELARLPIPPVLAWHSKYTPGEVLLYDPLRPTGSTADPGLALEDTMPVAALPADGYIR